MASPQLLYRMPGTLQSPEVYLCQSFVIGEPLEDQSNMHNIDPLLDSSALDGPTFGSGSWAHPQQQIQKFLDSQEKTAFYNASPSQSAHFQQQSHQHRNGPVLSSAARLPLQQERWGSPFSSQEHGSSSSSAFSPPGESEIFHESGPATPLAGVDLIVAPVHSYKQQELPEGGHTPASSFWDSPPPLVADECVAATGMSGYINPYEINPESQVYFDDFHNGSGIHASCDFESPERSFNLQAASSAAFDLDFSIKNTSAPVRALPAAIKPEVMTGTSYRTPSSLKKEGVEPEDEHATESTQKLEDNKDEQDGDESSDFTPTASHAGPANSRIRPSVSTKRKRAPKRSAKSRSQPDDEAASPKRPRRQSSQVDATLTSPLLSSTTVPESSFNNGGTAILAQAGHGHLTCRDCAQSTSFKTQGALDNHIKKQHKRPFVCVFAFAGCESTFASKNEWKRHVVSQHILLNYWICTQDACAKTVNTGTVLVPIPSSGDVTAASSSAPQRVATSSLRGRNSPAIAPASSLTAAGRVAGHQHVYGPRLPDGAIFNRKDLYTQHVRRMHTPARIKKQQKLAAASSSAPNSHGRVSSSASTAMTASAAVDEGELATWEHRVKRLQQSAEMERCQLPTRMSCPAPGCVAMFESGNAWDERMEHLAKHLEAAARGEEPPVLLAGGSGAQPDRSLIEWASRPDVAIIVPCGGGGATGLPVQWVLNNPLKPTGAAVMAVAAAAASVAVAPARKTLGNKVVPGEIMVDSGEEDAEGEEDDYGA